MERKPEGGNRTWLTWVDHGDSCPLLSRRAWRKFSHADRNVRAPFLNPFFVGVDEIDEYFDVVAVSQTGLLFAHF